MATIANIEAITLNNKAFRRVISTSPYLQQVVVMSIIDEIGNEMHPQTDQFIKIEKGEAMVIINNRDSMNISQGYSVQIPKGTWHNIINVGPEPLKLYTVYSPPQHKEGLIQEFKPAQDSD
jgi:mannose-6-phosphate isomerase-like protein (cupin superfamily)